MTCKYEFVVILAYLSWHKLKKCVEARRENATKSNRVCRMCAGGVCKLYRKYSEEYSVIRHTKNALKSVGVVR